MDTITLMLTLAPSIEAPELRELAEFVREGSWSTWRYNNFEIRAVYRDGEIDRLTFIADDGDELNTLRFISVIRVIYILYRPWDIITNMNSETGFIIKFIYNREHPDLETINRFKFGVNNADTHLLNEIFDELRGYDVGEQLC